MQECCDIGDREHPVAVGIGICPAVCDRNRAVLVDKPHQQHRIGDRHRAVEVHVACQSRCLLAVDDVGQRFLSEVISGALEQNAVDAAVRAGVAAGNPVILALSQRFAVCVDGRENLLLGAVVGEFRDGAFRICDVIHGTYAADDTGRPEA